MSRINPPPRANPSSIIIMIFPRLSRKFQTQRADIIYRPRIVAICQTVSFRNRIIFHAGNNSEHNIETVFRPVHTAGDVLEFTLAFPCPTSLKFHKTHTPCHSHRATLYGSAEVLLQQNPRHEYPACANYFYAFLFFPALKYSRYIRSVCARLLLLCNILQARTCQQQTCYCANNKRDSVAYYLKNA